MISNSKSLGGLGTAVLGMDDPQAVTEPWPFRVQVPGWGFRQ